MAEYEQLGEAALGELNALVGHWTIEARPPEGSPWAGGTGQVDFEWLNEKKFLIQRWTIDAPEAPDGIAIIGAGGRADGLRQHYFDSRGVHRIYDMSLMDGVWKLWRDDPDPFPQRYVGTFSGDGKTITGRWERADGSNWEIDFDLTYRKVE